MLESQTVVAPSVPTFGCGFTTTVFETATAAVHNKGVAVY
ncbi:hypothetical protein FEDK69T_24650 [Flavobacterium enshiense DK69]|nr:hypothetical protein FEDK69T_24650 [Flavobacterium enshiense DK69]